ncbi:MAG: helix-turn-helix domain-containing protein [Eubacteriales bacterium]|nr:helix-turn-helix domain-containing protein [Eubacteriales bacterium]
MPERLLMVEEVATALGVEASTVRKWLRDKQLTGVKMGRLWRVREEDLQAFLAGRVTDQGGDRE